MIKSKIILHIRYWEQFEVIIKFNYLQERYIISFWKQVHFIKGFKTNSHRIENIIKLFCCILIKRGLLPRSFQSRKQCRCLFSCNDSNQQHEQSATSISLSWYISWFMEETKQYSLTRNWTKSKWLIRSQRLQLTYLNSCCNDLDQRFPSTISNVNSSN